MVPAPKQRNIEEEKAGIKDGRIPETWKAKPAKLRQKDRDARWSVKYTKAKVKEGADPKAFKPVDLANPMFGYKNHIGIDRAHGLIRTWDASSANAHDSARLPDLISTSNTGSGVWADTPIPWQQFVEAVLGDVGDPREDIGKPGLGIDIVELRRADEAQHEGGALTAEV